jgi:hypothetical protein
MNDVMDKSNDALGKRSNDRNLEKEGGINAI